MLRLQIERVEVGLAILRLTTLLVIFMFGAMLFAHLLRAKGPWICLNESFEFC